MVTAFYDSILPPLGVGLRAAAVFKGGLKNPPTHQFFDTNEDLVANANTYDGLGKNVYHGCASYKEGTNRKGSNVEAVRSLWADFDVGQGKPYATQREAAAAFEAFRVAVGLPKTWMISSGNGVHVYLPFTKAISPENWDRLAEVFAACMDHHGVKHDTSRTQDKASILRVPGTKNYKTDPAKDVSIRRVADPAISAGEIFKALKTYAEANGVIYGAAPKAKVQATNDLIGNKDYPPSEATRVAKRCPIINEIEATGGDAPFEVWWRALGVAKFTTTPTETAIHWTRNRAALGKEKTDGPGKMEEWNAGPTSCAEFSKHSDKCASCKHFNSGIKGPLQLGVEDLLPKSAITLPTQVGPDEGYAETVRVNVPTLPGEWGFGTEWVVEGRCKGTNTGYDAKTGKMMRTVREKSEDSEDGFVYKAVGFCNRYWQVMRRIKTIDGVWQLEIAYETYPGSPPATFLFDSANVLVPELLKKEFSARELHIYGGKPAMEKAADLLMFDQALLHGYQQESATYPTMGWVTRDNNPTNPLTGDFIIGNQLYSKKKPPAEIILSDAVPENVAGGFNTSGSIREWVHIVDEVYNRRGAEAYQFVIAAMFAAPLVKLTPGGGEWHGIPIGLGGDSAAAKTTTALVAASIYTNPQALKFSAHPKNGDTVNALAIKVGALRNLPCVLDELTGADADRISDILFMMANGSPRDRATQTSKLVYNPNRWDMTSIITSNDNLHDMLETAMSKDAQDAGKLRLFQINLSREDLNRVFYNVNKTRIEQDLLAEQYGMVGRAWIQFIVDNLEAIERMLAAARRVYVAHPDEGSATRFYRDLILVVHVAALLARRRGFIKWDVERMKLWAEENLLSLRMGIGRNDWESDISDFVASLHGKTIITRHYKEGRGRRFDTEMPLEQLASNVIPVARKALDDRRFFVTSSYFREWCKLRKLKPKQLAEEMAVRGVLKIKPGTREPLEAVLNVGSGTTIARPRTTCLEFNYSAVTTVTEEDGEDGVTADVVPFPTPAPSVTPSVTPEEDATDSVAGNP